MRSRTLRKTDIFQIAAPERAAQLKLQCTEVMSVLVLNIQDLGFRGSGTRPGFDRSLLPVGHDFDPYPYRSSNGSSYSTVHPETLFELVSMAPISGVPDLVFRVCYSTMGRSRKVGIRHFRHP